MFLDNISGNIMDLEREIAICALKDDFEKLIPLLEKG